MSSKVEEYSGYVQIYKQQYTDIQNQKIQLENDRVNLMHEVLKIKVNLSTYKVLFFGLVVVITMFFTLKVMGLINRN